MLAINVMTGQPVELLHKAHVRAYDRTQGGKLVHVGEYEDRRQARLPGGKDTPHLGQGALFSMVHAWQKQHKTRLVVPAKPAAAGSHRQLDLFTKKEATSLTNASVAVNVKEHQQTGGKTMSNHEVSVQTPSGKQVRIVITKTDIGPRLECEIGDLKTTGYNLWKLKTPKQGATHYINSKPAIGLDEANAQRVDDAIENAMAAWREAQKQTPEGKLQTLRTERQKIQYEIADHLDEMSHHREKAYQKDTSDGWDKAKAAQAKAEAAEKKLAAFDEAHPEILAQINKEKAEARERFLATD